MAKQSETVKSVAAKSSEYLSHGVEQASKAYAAAAELPITAAIAKNGEAVTNQVRAKLNAELNKIRGTSSEATAAAPAGSTV